MSEGNFELDVKGWYTPQNVEENEFINNNLDNTDYGIYYSVKFAGDAETYLWQAKTAPVPGEKYYGHIEKTKNGKSLRFKKDKTEDEASPKGASQAPYKNNSNAITLGMVWKTVAGIRGLPENDSDFEKFFEIVKDHTDELVKISEKL